MKNVKIIMICKIEEKDIPVILENFVENYPWVNNVIDNYYIIECNYTILIFKGEIEDKYEEEIKRITHCAETIYDNTSAENVIVKVEIKESEYGITSTLCERILEDLSFDYNDGDKLKFINSLYDELSQVPDKSPIKKIIRLLCEKIEEL